NLLLLPEYARLAVRRRARSARSQLRLRPAGLCAPAWKRVRADLPDPAAELARLQTHVPLPSRGSGEPRPGAAPCPELRYDWCPRHRLGAEPARRPGALHGLRSRLAWLPRAHQSGWTNLRPWSVLPKDPRLADARSHRVRRLDRRRP